MIRTVLITGGNGFIGRRVSLKLLPYYAVVVVDNAIRSDVAANANFVISITDKVRLEELFRTHSFTHVVHLASLLNTASQKDAKRATEVNIGGSLNLLEMMRKYNVPRMIYGSSISIYGTKDPNIAADETTPTTPEDVYGATKQYVELLGDNYRKNFGIEFVALRIATVVGNGTTATASPWRTEIAEKLRKFEPTSLTIPYQADQLLPLVYVLDVADMLVELVKAEKPAYTVYNSPAETWRVSDLKNHLESQNPFLRVNTGEGLVRGIPPRLDSTRFEREFN